MEALIEEEERDEKLCMVINLGKDFPPTLGGLKRLKFFLGAPPTKGGSEEPGKKFQGDPTQGGVRSALIFFTGDP